VGRPIGRRRLAGIGIEESIDTALAGWPGSAVLAEWGYERNPAFDLNLPHHEFCDPDHTRRGAWRGAFRSLGVIHGFENSWGPWAKLDEDQPGMADLLLVRRFFHEVAPFAGLCPAPDAISGGETGVGERPQALATPERDLIAVYLPVGGEVVVNGGAATREARWFDPRTGDLQPAEGSTAGDGVRFAGTGGRWRAAVGLGARLRRGARVMAASAASAPGKVILLGEHGVNRCQPALAAAIDRRVHCRVARRTDAVYAFQGDGRSEEIGRADLLAHKERIDALRAGGALDELRRATAGDFFAPARYVLAHVAEGHALPGLDIAWRSELPVGAGLGSGAAASAAMAFAALLAAGQRPDPRRVADLAWQGDVIAHGGVASGLDSGASALGGVTRYTVADGPTPAAGPALTLVVADTGIQANTADVNTRVRRWLEAHPARTHLFGDMGLLVEEASAALESGDWCGSGTC
jgi:mevalonate kinase